MLEIGSSRPFEVSPDKENFEKTNVADFLAFCNYVGMGHLIGRYGNLMPQISTPDFFRFFSRLSGANNLRGYEEPSPMSELYNKYILPILRLPDVPDDLDWKKEQFEILLRHLFLQFPTEKPDPREKIFTQQTPSDLTIELFATNHPMIAGTCGATIAKYVKNIFFPNSPDTAPDKKYLYKVKNPLIKEDDFPDKKHLFFDMHHLGLAIEARRLIKYNT